MDGSGLVGKYVQYHALTIENGKLEVGGNGHRCESLNGQEWKFVPLFVGLRVLSPVTMKFLELLVSILRTHGVCERGERTAQHFYHDGGNKVRVGKVDKQGKVRSLLTDVDSRCVDPARIFERNRFSNHGKRDHIPRMVRS